MTNEEITEEQAIDKLHETGWMQRHDKEMTKRPAGEWICTFHSTFPQYEPSEYRCSKCNGRGNESDKFCKHCGAKMEVNNNG